MNIHPYARTLFMALAVVLLATTALQAQAPATPPPPGVKVGQEAPDFTATYLLPPDANGRRQRKEVKLSDFRGQKNVVLAFFPAAFSTGCTEEMSKYQATSGQFNANNTVILGISVDSPWANAAFAEKIGAQFTILSDAKRDVSRAYGVFDEQNAVARRTTFVIDRAGIVREVFMTQEALDPTHALQACAVLTEVK
jgi:peroxiredoxin